MEKHRILIVEDEGLPGLEMQEFLAGQGYDVPSPVATADRVVPEVIAHKPHLILMDIHLNGFIDGIDAAQRVRFLQPSTPVIFLTAYPNRTIKERALKIEPMAYLEKPVRKETLLRKIKISLGELN